MVYNIIKKIGCGTFSDVYLIRDNNQRLLAQKKCKIIKPHLLKNEHKILKILQNIKHPNIIRFIEYIPDTHSFIFERLYKNLYTFYKSYPHYVNTESIPYITLQCFNGLIFLHSLFIVHGDLKPENIMITEFNSFNIKIIDFGSSIICGYENIPPSYIVSRFYRAPEIIYKKHCNEKIDCWSMGCILYELYTFKTLFYGNINKVKDNLNRLKTSSLYFISSLETHTNFIILSNNNKTTLIQLLQHLLNQDSNSRISAADSIKLEYFNKIDINQPHNNNKT